MIDLEMCKILFLIFYFILVVFIALYVHYKHEKKIKIPCWTFQEAMIKEAIECSKTHLGQSTGGPFGAIVTLKNEIIGVGYNQVTEINDPTAHAEIQAIRNACKMLKTFDLSDCVLYSSCEPCPMCLCAMMWARIPKYYYAASSQDAADAGFDDSEFYKQINLPTEQRNIKSEQIKNKDGIKVLQAFKNKENKIKY